MSAEVVGGCRQQITASAHDLVVHSPPTPGVRRAASEQAPLVPRTRASRLDESALARLLGRQEGVLRRAQDLCLGGDDVDIRRKLRRRAWASVHPGVYVEHTGPLTRSQQVWAAVLLHWPAAVHRESALELHGLRQDRRRSSARQPVRLVI